MQLAKIAVGGRLREHVLPRAGAVETLGVERFVGRRYRVRFVIVVDECDAVADMDGQHGRSVLEIFDVDRGDGRKKRGDRGVGAGSHGEGEQSALEGSENLIHVGAYAATGARGWVEPSKTALGGISRL